MNFKERFDAFLTIATERVYTDEECVAIGALAQESLVVPTERLNTPPMVKHPLLDFWTTLASKASERYVATNIKAIHRHIYSPILTAVNNAKSEG